MSTATIPTNAALTPTSFLVLGLLAREGPSTPYDLKRHVGRTVGHFWTFPHTLLYTEPARLASLGFTTEEREPDGRRRRKFAVTEAGRRALRGWLGEPSPEFAQLRDPGLLQLFFADLGPTDARERLARERLAIHCARLASFEGQHRADDADGTAGPGARTIERWRGETVRMGILYERAAIEFWAAVAAQATGAVDGQDDGRDAGG